VGGEVFVKNFLDGYSHGDTVRPLATSSVACGRARRSSSSHETESVRQAEEATVAGERG
jgi:hypothetical protein